MIYNIFYTVVFIEKDRVYHRIHEFYVFIERLSAINVRRLLRLCPMTILTGSPAISVSLVVPPGIDALTAACSQLECTFHR